MKQFILISALIISSALFAQNHRKLITYGQVWGFLKYHHEFPSSVDWDERLISDFKALEKASDQEFEEIIDKLLIDCKFNSVEKVNAPEFEMMEGVTDWLSSDLLTKDQVNDLKNIQLLKKDFPNKYVKITKIGTAEFTEEKTYGDIEFDRAHLFLSITRYWNAINYFFPYRELIPENWSATYLELLPVVLDCKSEKEYLRAVRQLSARLQEGHGFVQPDKKNKTRYPMHTQRIFPFHLIDLEDGTFITSVPTREGDIIDLRRGDRILSINGQTTEVRWKEVGEYMASSNEYASRKYDWYFRQTDLDSVNIEVIRDEKIIKLRIPTYTYDEVTEIYNKRKKSIPRTPVPAYEERTDSVSGTPYLYVDLAILTKQDIDFKFRRALRKNEHVVIDVRNYPNWTILKLCKVLIKGKQHFALGGRMTTLKPGAIKFTPTQKVGSWREYKGNVYILVDRVTQSQAEYTVMGLQLHPRATTIGGQTAGADGNVTNLPLPYGLKASFSGIAIVYPDGGQTQQTGIRRDIKVRQDSSYLDNPKNDRIYNTAIRLIRGRSKKNDSKSN